MPDVGLGRGPHFKPRFGGPNAVVALFPEKEVARLEKADCLGNRAVHKEGGSADIVHFLHVGEVDVVDFAEGIGFKFGDFRIPKSPQVIDSVRIGVAKDFCPEDFCLRLLFRGCEKSLEDVGSDDCVIIEKKDPLGFFSKAPLDADVVAAGKSEIFFCLQNGDAWISCADG